jgi:hypothetical protein
MWPLIKAEWQDNRVILAIGYFFMIGISSAFLMHGKSDLQDSVPAYRIVLLTILALLWLTEVVKIQKDKRDRIYALLPVSRTAIGFARYAPLLLYWFGLLVIYCVSRSVVGPYHANRPLVFESISSTGLVFMIHGLSRAYRDVSVGTDNKKIRRMSVILFVMIYFTGYILFAVSVFVVRIDTLEQIRQALRNTYFSGPGAVLILGVGLLFLVLGMICYKKRRLYLE